jgi:hypothetical protein
VEVVVADAGTAFIAASEVYSPVEYRAFFEKLAGKWKWISLVYAE